MTRGILISVYALAVCACVGFAFYRYLSPPIVPPDNSPDPNRPQPNYPLSASPIRLQLIPWHFGAALPGKEKKHRLEVTNTAVVPWTLKPVTSTCACATAKLSPETIQPGETAALEIIYRTPALDGRVGANLVVEFVDPTNTSPIFQVNITGEVSSQLAFDPSNLEFFNYAPDGKPPSQEVTLRNRSDQRVAIKHIEVPQWLQAECQPADETAPDGRPRQVWKLLIRLKPDKVGPGSESALLVVHTDSDQVGPASIPVNLKPLVEASAARLDFETVESGKMSQQKVTLRTAPVLAELTATDLTVTHNLGDELDVQVQQENPNLFMLAVRFKPKRPEGKVEGEVEIKTSNATVPPLRIPVTGNVARRR